jgi:hypothetical protein
MPITQVTTAYQPMLAPDLMKGEFPSTRYQGSKAKLVDWIWQQIVAIDSEVPYRNLDEYWEWRERAPRKSQDKNRA